MYIREITFSFVSSVINGADYLYEEFVEDPNLCMKQIIEDTEDDCLIIKTEAPMTITYAKIIIKAIIEEYCKNAEIPFRLEIEDDDSIQYSFEYEEDIEEEKTEEKLIRFIWCDYNGGIDDSEYSLDEIIRLIKDNNITRIMAM